MVLYFTWELEYSEEKAIALFAYVTCLAYLSPVLGALLADGQWGRYQTILRFGCLYVIGLAILSASALGNHDLSTQRSFAFVGLFLVCLGTGGIKPCVSAFGADQVSLRYRQVPQGLVDDVNTVNGEPIASAEEPEEFADEIVAVENDCTEESEQVRQFFAYFYFCINVGAVLSFVVVPFTRQNYGFGPAFSLSLGFMSVALLLFLWKRKEYIHHVPGNDGASLSTNFILCGWLLQHGFWQQQWFRHAFPFLQPSESPPVKGGSRGGRLVRVLIDDSDENMNGETDEQRILEQQLSDAAQAIHVLPILAMFPIFWSLYDQQSSVWTLQATKMKLDWHLTPENMNAVNPLEIMILIPLFDRVIYPKLESRGWNISPLRRMSWGMVLAAVSFSVSGVVESSIEYRANNGMEPISVLWQVPQITILSISEIFVSVTGLEFAYANSPDRLKAFLMALFLLTTAVGDFFSGILYSTVFVGVDRDRVMHICALLMLGNLCLFCFVSRWWEARDAHELRRAISTQGIELGNQRVT